MRKRILNILVAQVMLGVAALSLAPPSSAQYVITEIIDSTGDGGGNTLGGARTVALDSSGNVYVSGNTSSNAFKITPGGTITEIIDATGDGGGNQLTQASGVAVDSSGNVYVTGIYSDNVFKIAAPGTCSTGGTPCTITEIIDATGDGGGNTLDTPAHVAVDSSGNVYVAGLFTSNVFKIATPGTCSTGGTPCTITEIIDATGDGGGNTLGGAWEVAVDSSGNVYATGLYSDNAFKIATPGSCSTGGTACTITETIDSTGDGGGNTLDGAYGVAADSSGNIYVTGNVSDNAFKIATPGSCSTGGTPCTITEIIDSTGDGGGNTLDGPYEVAPDGFGNVYVTGNVSDNAFKIATPGTCSTGGTPCTITEIVDATGDGGGNTLDASFGVAVDSSDKVYVSGTNSSNAFRLTELSSSKWVVDIDFGFTELLLVDSVLPIEWTNTGVATVNGTPGGALASMRLPDAISGTTAIPLTDPENPNLMTLRMTGVGAGTVTFNGISDGPPLGSKNTGLLHGQMKMCLLFPGCAAFVPIPMRTIFYGSGVVGVGGVATGNGFSKGNGFKISVWGAPWTIGLASIRNVTTETPNGGITTYTVTLQGFVHGPASASSTVLSTSGLVQLVTPTFVETNLGSPDTYSALSTILKVRFIPEPGLLLLLTAGVVGLVVLGARRAKS